MFTKSINLPGRFRLDIKMVKGRKLTHTHSIFPNIEQVLRIRKGDKASRFFRHVFEHIHIKRLFGTNLAFLVIASTVIPSTTTAFTDSPDSIIAVAPTVIATEYSIRFPVDETRITQGYKFYHKGLDLDGVTGDPIRPIMPGKVTSTGYSRIGYGNNIIIDHGNGISSLYAHLSKIKVKEGQNVTPGEIIGEMGATGRAFGDHLHLEVYQYGKNINPLSILSQ